MSIRLSALAVFMAALVCVLFVTTLAGGTGKKGQQLKPGVWGGPHVRMEVESEGARLQFDCANAEITSPLVTDSTGSFNLSGRYTQESGGPVRADRKIKYHPAQFNGTLKGDTLDLTIILTDSGNKMGDFRLKYGVEPELVRCY